jgi:hypothetical protein
MLQKQIDLSELIRVIQSHGSKQANSLFMTKQKDTKIPRLARKFAFEKNLDERAWANEICGGSENSASYVWHKSILRKRLLQHLFHLEIRTGSARRKAIYRSQQNVFIVKMLILLGARKTAMSLIPTAMKLTTEFELTSDRINLLEVLCDNASLNGWRRKFEGYNHKLRAARELRMAEAEATSLVQQIDVESVGRALPSMRTQQFAASATQTARILLREFPTYNVGLAYYHVAIAATQLEDNYVRGITLCEDAKKFLSRFPTVHTPATQGEFELNRLWMALSSRSYETAAESAAHCHELFRDGSNNWFIAREYDFLLKMHTKQWREAAELQRLIVGHNRFSSQPEQVQQKWKLFGHYAALTSRAGHPSVPSARSKAFRKIMSELPVYRRDKSGYNASLFILQYLILASSGNPNALIDRSDAMTKYVNRYFHSLHDTQLYAFLKTLSILTNSDFDVEKTSKRAKRYIEQFSAFGGEKVDETQVLPFDMMWEWITNWIGTNPKFREVSQSSKQVSSGAS